MEVQRAVLMRSDANLERELDNRTFALQRDLLLWRLARLHGLPDEEKRKRCLEQLRPLCELLAEIEAFLRDQQEGGDSQTAGVQLTAHLHLRWKKPKQHQLNWFLRPLRSLHEKTYP